jgi:hypothetical protein
MSTYKITRIIRAAIHLGEACEVDGVRFEPVVPFQSDQILVSEEIQSDSYLNASSLFDTHLLPVVDATTVVTGAAFAPGGGSTLIEKARSKYVYLHAVRRRSSAHLTVVPTHHTDLIARSSLAARHLATHSQSRHAAYYLRQSALAENLLTSTFHALQAAEALSGGVGRTNQTTLKAVMGDAAYTFFYIQDPLLGEKRRNALAHGRLIEEAGLGEVTKKLQERLLERVRQNVGGSPGFPALAPVRGFVTFEPIGLFLEPLGELPALADLVDAAIGNGLHSASDPRWIGGPHSRRLARRW